MTYVNARTIVRRYPENPILCPEKLPFDCYSIFNAGATFFEGQYLLLLRVEKFDRKTYFYVATSNDGINFTINEEPINYPLRDIEKFHGSHRFDMRITKIDDTYYVCHALWLEAYGCVSAMAQTNDFKYFESIGSISVPSNRNNVLFPEKIQGLFTRLERPQNIDGSGSIWISYSPDLEYWGHPKPLKMPSASWLSRKCGAGAVPIRTPEGWLEIYHGTTMTASTENYYLGVMLLDLDDPSKVIGAPDRFILAAEKNYECVGQVPNVVFTAGVVGKTDGQLNIYYGGADTCMCLAETSIEELLKFCKSC